MWNMRRTFVALVTKLVAGMAVAGIAFLMAPMAQAAPVSPKDSAGKCVNDTLIFADPTQDSEVVGDCSSGDPITAYCATVGYDDNEYFGINDAANDEAGAGYVLKDDVEVVAPASLDPCFS
jgi:hypothetical protein